MHRFIGLSTHHPFVDSLIHWYVGSSTLVHWLIHWFTETSAHWLMDWFTKPLIDCIIESLIHRLTNLFIDSFLHWFIRSAVHGFFHEMSLASQQPFAYSLVHFTTSTIHCFCMAKTFLCALINISFFRNFRPGAGQPWNAHFCFVKHFREPHLVSIVQLQELSFEDFLRVVMTLRGSNAVTLKDRLPLRQAHRFVVIPIYRRERQNSMTSGD